MPKTEKQNHNFAALTFELVPGADGITTEAHLLPVGPFRSDDSRPQECEAWLLDAAIARKLIALAARKKTAMLIDYEHQSLRSIDNGKPAPAAGWCPNTLEWRDGKGLYAVQIGWTESAKRQIAAKEYRYISCVFSYSAKAGEVLEIVSFALTNTPAIDGLEALADMARAALSRGSDLSTTAGVKKMADEDKVVALTVERDKANEKVVALTTERDKANEKVVALTTQNAELAAKVAAVDKEKAEAALAADKAKCGEMIEAAMTAGILPPAEEAYAAKKNLADLTEYLEMKKPLALLTKQAGGKGAAGAGGHGLTEAELAACTKAGLTPEEFTKAK